MPAACFSKLIDAATVTTVDVCCCHGRCSCCLGAATPGNTARVDAESAAPR